MKIVILILGCLVFFSNNSIYSENEPIMITQSSDMEQVIFDGIWTHTAEWKRTSLNEFNFDDGTKIILRSAHFEDFIYFFVDAITDVTLDHGLDKAIVCLDAKNNKNSLPDSDDFCFGVPLGNKNGFVIQGGSPLNQQNNFKKIPNPQSFVGISSVSNEFDRYSKIPHSSYEFKIPIELIKRSDNYGFYLTVYDAYYDKFYSWPDVEPKKPLKIPPPIYWNSIVSPDKSLPEFNLPLLVIGLSLGAVLFIASKINKVYLN